MKEDKKNRKGTIITLGVDKMKRIPRVFETIYKLEQTPADDNDDLEKDETLRLHTLRTIDVEGVTKVPGKNAVNVNGDFDISLEDDDDETENDILNKVYADRDEAIAAWAYLTDLQVEKARKMKEKYDQILVMIETSKNERQF